MATIFEKQPNVISEIDEHSVDYFSVEYKKVELDASGLPINQLTADMMFKVSLDGSMHLQQPELTLYDQEKAPWVIASEKAVLKADGENLMLNGQVKISKEGGKQDKAITINSSDMKVHLPTHTAESQSRSELIMPPNKTVGQGMKIKFLKPIKLTFLSGVKGRYEIN